MTQRGDTVQPAGDHDRGRRPHETLDQVRASGGSAVGDRSPSATWARRVLPGQRGQSDGALAERGVTRGPSRRDEVAQEPFERRLDPERVGERPVLARRGARGHARAARCGRRGGGRSSACARAARTRPPGPRSPRAPSRRARAASVTSATNRSRSVPWRRNGRSISLPSWPSSSCWQHGTARITRRVRADGPIERRVRRRVAGVQADDEIDSLEVGVPRCRRPRTQARSVEPPRERLAIRDDVLLDVEPEELDLRVRGAGRGGRGART